MLFRSAVNDLKFYEESTPFVRGIFSSVKSDFRLGYKLPNGVEAFIMQKARRHSLELRPLVGAWFQELFHSSVRSAFHLSFTAVSYTHLDVYKRQA